MDNNRRDGQQRSPGGCIGSFRKSYKMYSIYIFIVIAAGFMLISCSHDISKGLTSVREYDRGQYDFQTKFDYFFVEGVKQKLMGNHGEALKYFEECIEMNPESDASYYQMAQILIGKGDISNGKRYVRKACEIEPGNLWYNMVLAGIYHQENKMDSAIVCYERAAKIYPDKEDLQITLARFYTENRNYFKAEKILEQFDKKYGVNERTTLMLIDNLIKDGKNSEANKKISLLLKEDPDNINYNGYLAEIYKNNGENEKARNVYRQLIERNPDNPAIQLALCDFLLTEKNYDELFELLNVILLNDKINRQEKISLISELIDNEDIIRKYGNKLELAIMLLESEFREDDIIVLIRPEFLQKTGQMERAAELLEEIIRSRPENYYAWEKLLFVYLDMKNFQALEKKGSECATRFNRSIVAKLLFANGAIENGNYDIALEELRKAEILAADNIQLKLQVKSMKADVYYRMKQYEKAFETFEEAIKIDGSDITLLNNYAYYLAEQNIRLKDAEKMAEIVIEKDRNNNTFLDTYAWVLYKRGKIKDAAKIMEHIINSGESEDAEYYEHYGYILKKMNKCSESIENWEKALELDSSKEYLKTEIENCRK